MPVNRTVVLSEVAYQRLQTYATIAGIAIEDAASDAITEWMRQTGDSVIATVQRRQMTSASKRKLMIVSSAGLPTEPVQEENLRLAAVDCSILSEYYRAGGHSAEASPQPRMIIVSKFEK